MSARRSELRRTLTRWVKPVELFGRRVLQYILSIVLWLPRRPLVVAGPPRILVIRLDARVGNLLMLTPFLASLKRTFPGAHTTVLCHESMQRVLDGQPDADALIPYVKWRVGRGPFSLIARIRKERFDLCFDAGSFPGVAVTHPLIARLSGARVIVGPDRGPLGRLYHFTVPVLAEAEHEIAQRLQLLLPFKKATRVETMRYRRDETLRALDTAHAAFVAAAAPAGPDRTFVCAIGSREPLRRVEAFEWAAIANALVAAGHAVTIVWGPGERALADEVHAACPAATVAPPSTLDELVALFRACRGMIGNDTGTSHLAVAVGARTCVCFVIEPPSRYGHEGPGRRALDLRNDRTIERIVGEVVAWAKDAVNRGASGPDR